MNGYRKIKSLHSIEPPPPSSDYMCSSKTKHENNPHHETDESTEKTLEFGAPKFRRVSSVSCSKSKQESCGRRAFSMRRSSSVSERYCRIHDQHVALADEEFGQNMDFGSLNKDNKSRRGILKSWKRILGLSK